MAKGITVHTGVYSGGTPFERPSAWIEVSVPLQLEAHEMVEGLGEHFLRGEEGVSEGRRPDKLPESLSQREIVRIYRDELLYWGFNLGTWSEDLDTESAKIARGWLTEIVLNAFPDMRGYPVR